MAFPRCDGGSGPMPKRFGPDEDRVGFDVMARIDEIERTLAGRRIFVTGHTGFTGGWTCMWLEAAGAVVTGFALPPDTTPSLFHALGEAGRTGSTYGDVCDLPALLDAIAAAEPDLILHLAAQPLVRRSYAEPVRTFMVNAIGTAHVLEAARAVKSVRGVLCITTDKVYLNREWVWPYRENDPLGGKDPYSASKAAAEMVIQSYAASYPWTTGQGPAVATARGGNIIGGGDWSEDRLVPDFVRAVVDGGGLTLRYPDATRPWQHVLSLVHGYILILSGLLEEDPGRVARAWNLGPQDVRQHSVRAVIEMLATAWARPDLTYMDTPMPEARALALDSSMARAELGWQTPWTTEEAVARTAAWYRDFHADPGTARAITRRQIDDWRGSLA